MAKKIVYIIGGIWNGSGMERVLIMKANYMAEIAGYDVYILLTESGEGPSFFPISPKIQIDNVHIDFDQLYTYPLHKRIFAYIRKQYSYKKRLKSYLLRIKPDITITAMRREINFINSIPDGSAKIGEIHFNKTSYRQIHFKFLPAYLNRWITKLWMRQLISKTNRLSRFIVLTYDDLANWNEIKNTEVIYNPLSFYPDQQSDNSSHNVIAVGRFSYQKGFDLLIEAWKIVAAKHPDWALHIFGAGERKPYDELIRKSNLENNCFTHPAVTNIIAEYCKSSIFVLSSRFEGFGMVITEAMACGVPPVSFTCPCGPRDIIRNGEDGLLAENGNTKELAEKICYLIEHDEERKQMGHQARINVQRFSISNIGKQWETLFEDVLKNKK